MLTAKSSRSFNQS